MYDLLGLDANGRTTASMSSKLVWYLMDVAAVTVRPAIVAAYFSVGVDQHQRSTNIVLIVTKVPTFFHRVSKITISAGEFPPFQLPITANLHHGTLCGREGDLFTFTVLQVSTAMS